MRKIHDISILIAEDESELLEYAVEYLQLFFETVYQASDGKTALQIYQKRKPDIIITDINMPQLDGLSLIEGIRKHDTKTKIIVLSAHSDQEKLLRAMKLQLVEYMIKPLQSDKLKAMLFKLVDEIHHLDHLTRLDEGYIFDTLNRSLTQQNKSISLTPREIKLLELLCEHANHSVSNEEIFHTLYEDQPDKAFSPNAITSLIKRIRTKLPKNAISNHYGLGYVIHTQR